MITYTPPESIIIGPLEFYLYGGIIGLGVAIVIFQISKKYGDKLSVFDYLFVMISTVVGARILFLLHNISRVIDDPYFSFKIMDGGLALFGALIAFVVTAWIVCRRRNINFVELLDTVFLYLPLAQSIGRFGNYVNQELFGYPTGLPWGIYIDAENRPPKYKDKEFFHPAFLYESILSLISFMILISVQKWIKPKSGVISAIYLINYGIIRLLVNRIRIDKEYLWLFETSDLLSIISILIGIILLIYYYRPSLKNSYQLDSQ
jgi:phosphatidylglycerol:prolipoprotein diacylglycerol transferase